MKKLLAILLALMLVLVNVAALAADGDIETPVINGAHVSNVQNITITKKYDLTGSQTHPADTLSFSVEWNGAEETGVDFVETEWSAEDKLPTIADVEVQENANNSTFTIVLPTYTTYGVFKYKITEKTSNVAGMTNTSDTLYLRVGVAKKDNATNENDVEIKYVAIRKADGTDASNEKTDEITNVYEAGTLTVDKKVTGNLGDKSKVWHFTVEFTSTTKTVKGTISYIGTGAVSESEITEENAGSAAGTIAPGEGWHSKTVYMTLTDGQNIQFSNLPVGVSYRITESEANDDGYETTVSGSDVTSETATVGSGRINVTESGEGEEAIRKVDADTVTFTNDKGIDIDTGVALDSVPYVLMMALAVIGMAVLFVRKREEY